MIRKEVENITREADKLFGVVEPVEHLEEVQRKISITGWICLVDRSGVYFIQDDKLSGNRRVISLEGVRTIRIREYSPQSDRELFPVRKDRYESIIAIFPLYKNNPVFDELASLDGSSIRAKEIIKMFEELNLLLY